MWYNKNPSIDKLCRGLALKVIQVMSQIHIVQLLIGGAPTFSRPYQILLVVGKKLGYTFGPEAVKTMEQTRSR